MPRSGLLPVSLVDEGEDGPGLDEAEFRREFGHLLPHDGAA